MSLSGPNSISIVIENRGEVDEAVTTYTSAEAAQAAFAALTAPVAPAAHYLFLEAIPTKEMKPTKVSGTYKDAFGVTRIFASGANGGEID